MSQEEIRTALRVERSDPVEFSEYTDEVLLLVDERFKWNVDEVLPVLVFHDLVAHVGKKEVEEPDFLANTKTPCAEERVVVDNTHR